jgi:hypothetical protein
METSMAYRDQAIVAQYSRAVMQYDIIKDLNFNNVHVEITPPRSGGTE